jgi:hypothetical protein
MSDQENRNPQHSDPQKPGPQKSGNQPNPSVQPEPKAQFPTGQPKSPQPVPEKHDQEKKQNA